MQQRIVPNNGVDIKRKKASCAFISIYGSAADRQAICEKLAQNFDTEDMRCVEAATDSLVMNSLNHPPVQNTPLFNAFRKSDAAKENIQAQIALLRDTITSYECLRFGFIEGSGCLNPNVVSARIMDDTF